MDNRTVLETIQAANDAANAAIQQVAICRDAMEGAIITLNRSLDELHSVKANLSDGAEKMGFMRPAQRNAVTGGQPMLTPPCGLNGCPLVTPHQHSPEMTA